MNTNLPTADCAECGANQCGECRRPDHRGREAAGGTTWPTCCCGRRFRPEVATAEHKIGTSGGSATSTDGGSATGPNDLDAAGGPTQFYADAGPVEVRIYSDLGRNDANGDPVVTDIAKLRAPDHGDVDALLRAHGWRRVSAWMAADIVPDQHRLAMVEPGPIHSEVDQLVRDQQVGRERRGGVS